jgi:gamma-tubulin complex component 4
VLLLLLRAAACTARTAELPWQSAANKSSAADDPHFANFSIVVNTAEAEALQAALQAEARKKAATSSVIVRLDDGPPDVADCLRVKAHLPWPLGVLITEDHLTCYNRLFALLLKVKRVQLDLEAAWQELGRCVVFCKRVAHVG